MSGQARLVPVTPAREGVRLHCNMCGEWAESARCFADLNGEPFRAYYCEPCADATMRAAP